MKGRLALYFNVVKVALLTAIVVGVYGFLCPGLVSSNHTELVITGIAVGFITIPIVADLGFSIVKSVKVLVNETINKKETDQNESK